MYRRTHVVHRHTQRHTNRSKLYRSSFEHSVLLLRAVVVAHMLALYEGSVNYMLREIRMLGENHDSLKASVLRIVSNMIGNTHAPATTPIPRTHPSDFRDS